MRITILLVSLLLASCGAVAPATTQAIMQPQATQAAQVSATPTIDHAATIAAAQGEANAARQQAADALDAARMAQLTSDAASRLLVEATMTHEAIQYAYMQATQVDEQARLQYGAMTMQVAWITGTAYETAYPMTATQQAQRDAMEAGRMTATAQAPVIARQLADAKWRDQYGWSDYLLPWVVVFVTIAMLIFIAWYLARKVDTQPEQEVDEIQNFDPIPMAEKQGEPMTTLRAEVPCTTEQLTDLANGIVNMKMSLAFNQWEGTSVHRSLKDIRDFLQTHKLARVLPGKGGELSITAAGEDFLTDCYALKCPPLPYKCAD